MKIIDNKLCKIILKINGDKTYSQKIANQTNTTYSHTVKIINCLLEKGIVNKIKDGRVSYIKLTNKGRQIKEHLIKIDLLYNDR